jgi:hypothetical protein
MLYVSGELRLAAWLGAAADVAGGWYRGASVGQVGVRLPFYPLGSFASGVQIGPMARASLLHLADPAAEAAPPESGPHSVTGVVFNDVEAARSNGRSAVYCALLVGGKHVFRANRPGPGSGLTAQAGVLIGYLFLVGPSRFGPAPQAAHVGNGFVPMLYAGLGYSL